MRDPQDREQITVEDLGWQLPEEGTETETTITSFVVAEVPEVGKLYPEICALGDRRAESSRIL